MELIHKVVLIKRGENRLEKMREVQRSSNRLMMKHLTIHDKPGDQFIGVQIRIAWKRKMHTTWISYKDHLSWNKCVDEARAVRDTMLKKLGKSLSMKTVIGATSSNTGFRGITYRPNCKYSKRGRSYVTELFDIRWWSEKRKRFFMTKLSVRQNGGYKLALVKALNIQEEKENSHKET